MTSDSILAIEVLLADGTIVKASKRHHSDLYWAHQGSCGNNYGIVLSLKFQLHSIPEVVLFEFVYTFDHFKEVLKIWQEWLLKMPNELNAEFSAKNNRGNVIVNGQYIGKEKALRKLLEPFYKIESIESRVQTVPYIEAVKYFTGLARWLPFFKTKNAFVHKPFPRPALDIMEDFMSRGNGEDVFGLMGLGGRNDEIAPDATAFVHRKGNQSWLLLNAHWSDQANGPEKIKWVTEFYDAIRPYLSGFAYQNAPDLALKDYLHEYYGSNLERLVEIKKQYDPENVFNYPQSIPSNYNCHDITVITVILVLLRLNNTELLCVMLEFILRL